MTTDWIKLNGREIESAYGPDTQSEQGRMIQYDVVLGIKLHLHAENCGDRLELWVVVTDYGKEISRHNLKFVQGFAWRYKE